MNWDAVSGIAEAIGASGVIISLVYVGLQVRQNTEQIRLSRAQDVTATFQDGFEPIYLSGNPGVWYMGHFKTGELSEEDELTFRMLMGRQIFNVQNIVYQYEHGLIDDAVFKSVILLMREFLIDTPGGAKYWEANRHNFTDALCAAIDRGA